MEIASKYDFQDFVNYLIRNDIYKVFEVAAEGLRLEYQTIPLRPKHFSFRNTKLYSNMIWQTVYLPKNPKKQKTDDLDPSIFIKFPAINRGSMSHGKS